MTEKLHFAKFGQNKYNIEILLLSWKGTELHKTAKQVN